ncbi:MAG TPA: hypothetical protein VF870_15735 [Ignavibacteriaceae bacterium]
MKKHFKIFPTLIILCGILFLQNSVLAQPKIAVLYSRLTEKIDNTTSNQVFNAITNWELFLMQDKIPYSVIYDEDIESGIEDEFDILILPSVNFISNEQMEELQKYMTSGNSIICSGSKLLFQDKSLTDFQNLKTLFGLNDIKTIPTENMSYLHSLVPSPINQFNAYDDKILQIANKNQTLFCGKIDSKVSACGFILGENDFNSSESSILYGVVGSSRFLWTGFDLGDIIGGNSDMQTFKRLISDAISWMDNPSDTYIANFNESLSAPVIVTLQYNNALESELVDILKKNNIQPILIISPDQKVSKEIFNKFANDEIVLDLSGNSKLTSKSTVEFINNFNQDNEVNISTILVDKQFLEINDLILISENGISKMCYIDQAPGIPELLNKDLLTIPFVTSKDVPKSREVINYLNYIPKVNCDINPEDELLKQINQIKSSKYNFVTPESLKKWWSVKQKITTEIKYINDNEIEIWLSNNNLSKVSELEVFLNYINKIDKKSLTISLNNSLLEYSFDDASGAVVINLENILPNSLNKIKIKFDLE